MVNDISRALFHAKPKRKVCVQLPSEDMEPSEQPTCGRLNYSMHGTRDATQNWFEEYSENLIDNGFKHWKATPCIFYNEERAIRTHVHGDDYVSIGLHNQLMWLKGTLEERYQVKTRIFGPDDNQLQEITILNRSASWCKEFGIHYGADPSRIEIIIEQFGLQDAKPICSPGTKEERIFK